MDKMELWINDEYYCDLMPDIDGYYKISTEDARWLSLSEGDTLEVKRVWREE